MHLEHVVCMHMVNKVITSNSIIKTTAAQVEIQAEPNTSLTFIGSHFLRLSTATSENRQTWVSFEMSFGTDFSLEHHK